MLAIEGILGYEVLICSGDDKLCPMKFSTEMSEEYKKQSINDQKSGQIYGLFIVEDQSFCLLSADWSCPQTGGMTLQIQLKKTIAFTKFGK